MAELTRTQLTAAAERAAGLSLADQDVALQTSDSMPERLGVNGATLDTAGAEQHGPVYSFTRKDVETALERWSTASSGRRRSPGRPKGSGTRSPAAQRRASRTREQAAPGAETTGQSTDKTETPSG